MPQGKKWLVKNKATQIISLHILICFMAAQSKHLEDKGRQVGMGVSKS